MKLICVLTALLISTSVFAGNTKQKPNFNDVIYTLSFDLDKDGRLDSAYLVKSANQSSGDDLDLWIKMATDTDFYKIESLTTDVTLGAFGMANELQVNPQGSLQVHSYNDSIGRSRWTETVTFAYRKGEVVLAGYTYFSKDTLDSSYSTCDLNLLAFKGTLKSSDGDATFDILRKDRLKLNNLNYTTISILYLGEYCSSYDVNESDF